MTGNVPNRVTVRIMDEDYVVKGKAKPEYIQRLGQHVDAVMAEIRKNNPCLSTTQVAILAAINIAADFYRVKEDYEELLELLKDEEPEQQRGGGP
ncbi:MAG: cell division protein ZapA [Bacillota bacterium]|jgi:cell division protein ZapA|nr:cell division protein ZapA [Bacillota bacterium]MDK2882353.1 cell division protein ZapA [Bacillota bacterium]MDK2960549.1 cell division protein ZapA [Bacillota bacterium]